MPKRKISNKKLSIIYKITFFLALLWIIISLTKKIMNLSGVQNYNFIQRNTVGFWLLIFISLSISKYMFKKLWHASYIFIILFIIHEILWYNCYIQITKDEEEVTSNCYNWMNIYCTQVTNKQTTNSKENDKNSADLSESLFDYNWNISNEESYKIKFGTYFEYLKLKPGMKLLDIGCGNCQWLQYCKERGVNCTGITISNTQQKFCNKNGIPNIIVGDIQKGVLTTLNEKFDAVSAIGPAEHFSSISQTPQQRQDTLQKYYDEVKSVINTNSESARYLNSYMTTNNNYSKFQSLEWYAQIYLVASTFGYGFYNPDIKMSKIYNSANSKIVIKRDYTEDYRWIMVREPKSIGFCNYNFETPYRFFNFVRDVFVDFSWWQRFLYGYYDSWFWQFGGTNPNPMPENKDTPIRSYIYVTQIY